MKKQFNICLSLLLTLLLLTSPTVFAAELNTNENTENESIDESIFEVAPVAGTNYDGYIFKLKDHTEDSIIESLDDQADIEVIYSDEDVYTASSIEEIRELVDAKDIEYIEPDYIGTVLDDGAVPLAYANVNDSRYNDGQQWGLTAIRGAAIWTAGLSAKNVTIGIIDSGLYTDHEDINTAYVKTGYNYVSIIQTPQIPPLTAMGLRSPVSLPQPETTARVWPLLPMALPLFP